MRLQVPLTSSQRALLLPKMLFYSQNCCFFLELPFYFPEVPFYFPEVPFCFPEVPFCFPKMPYCFPELLFTFPEVPSLYLLRPTFSKNDFFPAHFTFSSSVHLEM